VTVLSSAFLEKPETCKQVTRQIFEPRAVISIAIEPSFFEQLHNFSNGILLILIVCLEKDIKVNIKTTSEDRPDQDPDQRHVLAPEL
jgi:hypothetical protein